jgi:hydroxymethylbilane synthase
MQIRIGSRESKLALIQTDMVIKLIAQHFPGAECVVVPIKTTGDKITDKNLYDIGGKALFLKELEEQLLAKKIDIAVHSLKDVPGVLPEGLVIAAVTEREDSRDCFVSLKYKSIEDLPIGAVVGSSSVRRKVIIQQKRPDLKIVQFRGNVQTRLAKLKNGEVDATIFACAGLIRASEFTPEYCYPLEHHEMLPAAGQGIIAVEARADDKKMLDLCAKINHTATWHLAEAERGLLSYLDASCRTPLAAHAVYKENRIEANYMLADIDGKNIRYHTEHGDVDDAPSMGVRAGMKLSK